MSNEAYKPTCQLTGTDGNVFSIIGRVHHTLVKAGLHDTANEFMDKALGAESYDHVLQLCFDYVEVE